MILQNHQRWQAIGLLQAGHTYRQIAIRFGVHYSTICRLNLRYKATGTVRDRPRPCQRRVTTARQDVNIRLLHRANRFRTPNATARIMPGRRNPTIHPVTVRRRLKVVGLRCRRPYRGPRLTQRHKVARRRWTAAHARWALRRWNNVMFSDETKVMIDSSDRRQRVYRRVGERYNEHCVVEEDRFGRASLMVWAGITSNHKTDLVFLDQGVGLGGRRARVGLNAQGYINNVLRPVVLPFFQRHPQTIFMQDNARPHVANLSINFLNQNGIPLLNNWPAMSADLNPIEHLWDYLKRRIRTHNLNNVQDLRAALQAEWRRIPQAFIRTLVGSMRRRCVAVRNANGGHCRY